MSVRMDLKKITVLILTASFLLMTQTAVFAGNLKVSASFYPLAHFAERAGGDLVDVTNIMPPGAEPHEFEPTPRDIGRIYKANVFIFQGGGIDPWARRIRTDLERNGVLVIEMSDHFSFLRFSKDKQDPDPHIWLDPVLAKEEVGVIRDAFIQADPVNKDAYISNSSSYSSELDNLDRQYRVGLQKCASNEIIVTHDAFNYLARRYGFRVSSIMGISPEEEPSPKKLVALAKLIREKGINYVFFESLVSPKLAMALAGETGAKALVLNPLGGLTEKDIREGKTYISVMEENLQNLRTALKCE